MNYCFNCRNCRRKIHTDAEVGPEESYATFWCMLLRKPIYLPRESGCSAYCSKKCKEEKTWPQQEFT